MANKPMGYLDDQQFYLWMAVCAKKNLKSDTLLKRIVTDYTKKNLSPVEVGDCIRNMRNKGITKNSTREPVIQNNTISAVENIEVINVNEVSSGDDITSEKVKVIKEKYGGKMEVK